eukprot:756574-Hanusia_phi.AAC.2
MRTLERPETSSTVHLDVDYFKHISLDPKNDAEYVDGSDADEHAGNMKDAEVPTMRAQSLSALSRPSWNSTAIMQKKILEQVAKEVDKKNIEMEVNREMKRISKQEKSLRARQNNAIKGNPDVSGRGSPEADLSAGLTAIDDYKPSHVLRPKVVKKQVDPRWESNLELSPDISLFKHGIPYKQNKGCALPRMCEETRMTNLPFGCSPVYLDACLREDFTWKDLFAGDVSAFR